MLCMNDCQLDCAVEDKLYRELSQLTKDKTIWREKIPYIGSLITDHSPKQCGCLEKWGCYIQKKLKYM